MVSMKAEAKNENVYLHDDGGFEVGQAELGHLQGTQRMWPTKGKRCYKILKCGELQLTEFCRLKLTLPIITRSDHKRIVCS